MHLWSDFPSHLACDASMWSADFTRLGDEIRRVDAYVDYYHFDVSDNHLTPGLLFFPDLIAGLRPLTQKPFHVHLMVDDPPGLIDEFVNAGADLISIQSENNARVAPSLAKIREAGCGTGLAFSLTAPPEEVLTHLKLLDLVVMMGTPLGVKGLEPSPLAYARIQKMRTLLRENGATARVKIEADGGIRQHTVPELRAAGADLVVMGSLLFTSSDLPQTFSWLHGLE
jgi:ribulose-phosphate 3-epimerase